MHFVPFGCICDHSVALQNSGQNILNKCKSSWHEDMSEFFTTNAPNPPHWTLNTCFGAFCTFCMHLVPLGWLTKLEAKRSELVQNFVPRSRIRILRNKCTGSIPFGPKLMFWCISYHLGASSTVWLPHETLWKTGRTSAKFLATKSRQKFLQRTHPIHSIGP